MGSCFGISPIMRLMLTTFLFLALSDVTLGIFFDTPRSSCSSNRQCRTFARTQCLGDEFIFFCSGKPEPTQFQACASRDQTPSVILEMHSEGEGIIVATMNVQSASVAKTVVLTSIAQATAASVGRIEIIKRNYRHDNDRIE